MKATIRSIAQMCGVSRGTVDRVLNNRPYVKPEVRKRVLQAVEQTGYVHPTDTTKPGAVRMGFIRAYWENEYFSNQIDVGIRKAKRYLRPGEMELIVEIMQSRTEQEYLQRIDRLVSAGVRGIILNTADTLLLRTRIEQLYQAGIVVITYNSDLPDTSRLCYVGQDLGKSAQVAGGLFAKILSGQDKILMITGNLEFSVHRKRMEKFCAYLDSVGISQERVILRECFERYDLTYDAVFQLLRQDARIAAIYLSAESVPGCMDAVKKAAVRQKICVIANELTPMARHYLKQGQIDFVIEQDFAAQAYEAILDLYTFLAHGRKPKKQMHYVRTSIYTKELL